jgi:teichuronic acid biosynthesis glycosyltransferase TuaC
VRLLFLSNEFPNVCKRSKATFNYDLLTALAREHEVTVVSPISWWEELRTRCKHPFRPWARTCHLGRLVVHHPRFYYTPGRLRHLYGTFMWWSMRATVSRILREPRPDCVLSYWAHPDGEAAVRLAQVLGVPSMVMVGGSDVLVLTRDPRRAKCVRRVLEQADAVVALSRDLAAKVVEMGIAPHRVHVMRRGVDSSLFSPGDRDAARRQLGLPTDRRLLLWVGRMVPVKGLDILIAACQLLKQQTADFRLYLIGDGPQRASLAAEVQRLGLSEHVTFVGPVDHDRLGVWFQAADLTVMPSRSEGIPNTLLESLACGTPFVASAVGGVPEIAGHAAGRLVPPERPDELAAALEVALAERLEVAEADRPHSLQQFAEQVADLARKLLQSQIPRQS